MLYHITLLIFRMDPLKYLFRKPALSGRLAWWYLLLAEFDINHVMQKPTKGQAIADHLAVNSIGVYIIDHFPDESILNIEAEEEHHNWQMDLMEHQMFTGWK